MQTTTIRFSTYAVLTLVLCVILVGFTQPTHAAITTTGDIDPDDPGTWTSDIDGYIGKTGNGTLDINAGSDISTGYGYIGYGAGVSGTVMLEGSGSEWINKSGLKIGSSGNGSLHISGGALATQRISGWGHNYVGYETGSTGIVTVDGRGSRWTNDRFSKQYIGYRGTGTLHITNGGFVESGGTGYIGHSAGSKGTVIINGHGSRWDGGYIRVGAYGEGILEIKNGGSISQGSGYVGRYPGSKGEAIIDGSGSSWACAGDLDVGFMGQGTISITSGGVASCDEGSVGKAGQGQALVDGNASKWRSSEAFTLGYGTLNIPRS